MIQCAWAMKRLGSGDRVSFVCDEHEQYGKLAARAYQNLKSTNPNAARYMGSFSMADDTACEPLQAADAVAFEIRRVLNLALGQWPSELRQQFRILGDSDRVFLIQHTEREHLLRIVATHGAGEPFRLDEIMNQDFAQNIKLVGH